MKAMFAWLSLLTSLANLFAVASGQPEEGPAKLKTFIPEVRIWLFCIDVSNLGIYFISLKLVKRI